MLKYNEAGEFIWHKEYPEFPASSAGISLHHFSSTVITLIGKKDNQLHQASFDLDGHLLTQQKINNNSYSGALVKLQGRFLFWGNQLAHFGDTSINEVNYLEMD